VAKQQSASVSTTDRLNEESMASVLEIVLDNMMKRNMVCPIEINGMRAMAADMHVMISARELWYQVVQREIIKRVRNEVVKRKLLPVTIHTLSSLLHDTVESFQ